MVDEYKTIGSKTGEGHYSERRSKFLSFAHHVTSEEEVKAVLAAYRKKYFDARHVCYAYVLGAERDTFRANDDGEPSGTAGRPIIGQINSNELTDVLVVVVRYYGGVNLGTSGLIAAYRAAASAAIADSEIRCEVVEEEVEYSFPYVMMNAVMRVAKGLSARIVSQEYGNTCDITFSIRKSEVPRLKEKLGKLSFE